MGRRGVAETRRGASLRGILLVSLVLAAGCMPDPTPAPGTLRFLALGDSYTIGEGVAEDDRWPVVLAHALRKDSLDPGSGPGQAVADPEIVAVTGWTVAELGAGIDDADPQGPFDLVTLLIGVNDQYRGGTAEAYRPAFRATLARAVGFAGGDARRVVVVSIPDYGATPFAVGPNRSVIGPAIDAFNAAAEAETAAAGARWVDVTRTSRETGPAETGGDGLHPSAAQYVRWARLIEPAARAALAEVRE